MADSKVSALTTQAAPLGTDEVYLARSSNSTEYRLDLWRLLALAGLDLVHGRLTLTSGTPITTSDVTAAETLYFAPFNGNRITLYDGTAWDLYSFSEINIAVPATTSQMYDVFIYDNSGTPALELTAWTNDTTRATALVTQDGVYVKSGATTRRYLGSFRTTTVSGQTEDSVGSRLLWNYYNRVVRSLLVIDTTDSWTYATATWRLANNSALNVVKFVIGIMENPVVAQVIQRIGVNVNEAGACGIGVDSTAANSAQLLIDRSNSASEERPVLATAIYQGYPGIGYHYLSWLEYARAGTVSFYGDSGVVTSQSGLMAAMEA